MFHTLDSLLKRVNALIEEQGKDAPCAAFIYTKEDVIDYFEEIEGKSPEEKSIDNVLYDLGNSDWIYEQIGDHLEDDVKTEVKRLSQS